MYALKPPSFLRPSSRPTSPAPPPRQDTPTITERARPLSKLSLSTFRRPSPSPATHSGALSSTVVQDGSFTEVLGLKLSEAVSKALAQPAGPATNPGELLAGRRPIPAGRGRTLGALIISEIEASRENPHLYRAVIRTLQRPLSVLLTNLSNNLIPLLSSPAFHTPTVPTPQEPQYNATQLHAIALATFAGELLESFDEIGLGVDVDARGDSLKGVREGLVSTVKRVVDPLLNAIKNELVPLIEALETVPAPPATNGTATKASGGIKSPMAHPSIMSMQTLIPIYARALSRVVASAYAESALASLLISLVWRGMVALAHRPVPQQLSPPGSPSMAPNALKPKDSKKALGSPPGTPPASRFTLKLPPSRPPTPPSPASRGPTVAGDARALYNLITQLPKPSSDKAQSRLAREVVDEAFEGLSCLIALLESIQVCALPQPLPQPVARSSSSSSGTGSASTSPRVAPLAELEADLDVLTADIPVVIALPVLLRTYLPAPTYRGVPALLGMAEGAYRASCLSGFGRAEECGIAVGQRVLEVLRADGAVGRLEGAEALLRWLERELELARAEREAEGARVDGDGPGH